MKKYARLFVVLAFCLNLVTVQADKYESKSHKVSVSGTSTLHDWSCPASKVSAKGDFEAVAGEIKAINSLWVEVEAKSIKSEKESMDEKIYEALKTDRFQKITFQFLKTKSIEKKGNDWVIVANGTLTVAGEAQNVDLSVTAKVLPNGDLQFEGSKKTKMTSFKVDPPSAMWGVIKSGDEIVLKFEVTMKKV